MIMILTVMSHKLNLKHLASGECFFFISQMAIEHFIWITNILFGLQAFYLDYKHCNPARVS